VCQLDWYVNGNIDINGVANAYGSFGSGTLSGPYCTVYTSESTLVQTAQGYDVSVVLSFPQPLPNTIIPAWTLGITAAGAYGDYTPVGAHIIDIGDGDGDGYPPDDPEPPDSPLDPGLGPPYCMGYPNFDSQLSRYADGTLAAALTAYSDPAGNPGWVNQVDNGHLLSSSGELANTAGAVALSMDGDIAVLPFNSGSGNPGGTYQVVGDYHFGHPQPFCYIVVAYGFPGYVDNSGNADIWGYTRTFNLSGAQADPAPYIDSVTLDRPLVEGDTSVATIEGGNFGLEPPTITLACSSDNTSAPCTSSDVTAVVSGSCPLEPGVSGSGMASSTSSCVTATLTASSTAIGDYDLTLTSNGTYTYGGDFQQAPGTTNQATQQQAATAIQANMALQLNGTAMIDASNNYSEDTTVQVTAVRPDTGATIAGFAGTVNIGEMPNQGSPTIYNQNGGNLPSKVSIGAGVGGTTTFTAKSLAGPYNGNAPGPAQITTVNYPLFGGGTLAVPQWIITGNGKQVDPQHSGGNVYDWVQARALAIFNANPPNSGNLGTVLAAVSNYTVANLNGADGQTAIVRGSQSPIVINVYQPPMRTDSSVGGMCGVGGGPLFTGTLIHEARHAYQAAQAAMAGNDQDGDWLVNNTGPVPPVNVFLDTAALRTVCNPLAPANTFQVGYRGDGIFDPFLPSPQSAADQGEYADYALEMDAIMFTSNQQNPPQ
jgi:hypothetical protein